MNKKLFFVFIFSCSQLVLAQVGIGTATPSATFEVARDTKTPLSSKDGIIPPKLSKQELANKTLNTYGIPQNGAIVYVRDITAPTGTTPSSSQVTEINSIGHYTFDSTLNKWIALDISIYAQNGKLTSHRTVNQDDKNLFYTYVASTDGATNIADSFLTDHHIYDNPSNNILTLGALSENDQNPLLVINPESGKVGIKTIKPRTTLHIKEDTRERVSTGLIIPRLTYQQLFYNSTAQHSSSIGGSTPYMNSTNPYRLHPILDESDEGTIVYVYDTENRNFNFNCQSENCDFTAIREVTEDGFYYFNKNGFWRRLIDNSTNPWYKISNSDPDYAKIILTRPNTPLYLETNGKSVNITESGNMSLGGTSTTTPRTVLDIANGVIATQEYKATLPNSTLFPNNLVPVTQSLITISSSSTSNFTIRLAVPTGIANLTTSNKGGFRTAVINNTNYVITVQSEDGNITIGTISSKSAKNFYFSNSRWYITN